MTAPHGRRIAILTISALAAIALLQKLGSAATSPGPVVTVEEAQVVDLSDWTRRITLAVIDGLREHGVEASPEFGRVRIRLVAHDERTRVTGISTLRLIWYASTTEGRDLGQVTQRNSCPPDYTHVACIDELAADAEVNAVSAAVDGLALLARKLPGGQ